MKFGHEIEHRVRIFRNKRSRRIVFILMLLIPLGLLTKIYSGPGNDWVNHYAGGVLYEIFFCFLIFLIWPSGHPFKIAIMVFSVTVILEFLQLWHPAPLVFIRNFFLGRALLGNTFSWYDFPHYLLGCILGWLGIHLMTADLSDMWTRNEQ